MLDVLAQELAGKLATIAVLPPSAPRWPWLGECELGKPPGIFECQRTAAHTRETREAAAAKRLAAVRRWRPLRAHAKPGGSAVSLATALSRQCL